MGLASTPPTGPLARPSPLRRQAGPAWTGTGTSAASWQAQRTAKARAPAGLAEKRGAPTPTPFPASWRSAACVVRLGAALPPEPPPTRSGSPTLSSACAGRGPGGPDLLGAVQRRSLVQLAVRARPYGGGERPDGALLPVFSIPVTVGEDNSHEGGGLSPTSPEQTPGPPHYTLMGPCTGPRPLAPVYPSGDAACTMAPRAGTPQGQALHVRVL